ncbi:MAG: hypothetical protein F6J90_10715 [Moorea sp. SIOASIH]|uniref:hypothetical protein n=1 Tax=Moorena sp. SIOASIH TaxID=2607817 RepID=UPI0013BE2C84|nr:hypothetical protein [Moorena sp. SIOASIH]NEO36755.1 hypothetical protein [Moorena sp. SIOASIH]
MGPYTGERDLHAIANLINSCEAVDQLDEGMLLLELPHLPISPSPHLPTLPAPPPQQL